MQYKTTFSSFSVDDIAAARDFYAETLSLDTDLKEGMGLELRFANGATAFLYGKEDHVPATFTVLNFLVSDIETAVKDLKQRGVVFEAYTGTMATDEQGIFRDPSGGPVIAWFKDPAGNVLSVIEG